MLSGLLVTSCAKPASSPVVSNAATPAAEKPTLGAAEQKKAMWRTDRFCVMATQLRSATPVVRRVQGLVIDTKWLEAALKRVPELNSDGDVAGPKCAKVHGGGQVGVAVTIDYGGTGLKGGLIAADKIPEGGRLYVSAIAHIERAGPTGKPELAQSTVEASGPLVRSDAEGLKRRVRARLAVATALAVRRALGQLWIRHQTDTDVRVALTATNPWRRGAALLEVGERGLVDATATVEKAATASRADIAVVACATLGRLAQPSSVGVLEQALNGAPTEVADAALYALHDIGNAAAKAAVAKAAKRHQQPWIRLRAKALLDADARNN